MQTPPSHFRQAQGDSKPLLITDRLRVEGYHVDAFRVVTNGVYIRWLDDMRIKLLETTYPMRDIDADGLYPTVAKTTIEYRRPAHYLDEIDVELWVDRMLQGKWTVLAQFWRGKTLLARAEQEVYCISAETLRPVAVPARLREAFNAACAADSVQGSAGDSSK